MTYWDWNQVRKLFQVKAFHMTGEMLWQKVDKWIGFAKAAKKGRYCLYVPSFQNILQASLQMLMFSCCELNSLLATNENKSDIFFILEYSYVFIFV